MSFGRQEGVVPGVVRQLSAESEQRRISHHVEQLLWGKDHGIGDIDLGSDLPGGCIRENNFCCFSVNDAKVTLKIEGKGDHVLIS